MTEDRDLLKRRGWEFKAHSTIPATEQIRVLLHAVKCRINIYKTWESISQRCVESLSWKFEGQKDKRGEEKIIDL